MKPISDSQLLVSAQVVDESNSIQVNGNSKLKSGWISHKKNDYWFVLNGESLTWYKNEKIKDKKNSISLKGTKMEHDNSQSNALILIHNKKSTSLELSFDSSETIEKWKQWLQESGVELNSSGSPLLKGSDTYSVSNMSMDSSSQLNGKPEWEMADADHMKASVDQVKKLVDSYILIMKKKFKDYIPKICTIEMVDSTREFISIDLRLRVRDSITSIDDIVKGDPEEELRRELTKKSTYYSEAIDLIDKFTNI